LDLLVIVAGKRYLEILLTFFVEIADDSPIYSCQGWKAGWVSRGLW